MIAVPGMAEVKETEATITDAIRHYLKINRIWHYKHYNGGAYQALPGISDIIGIYRGRFLAIEVKTKKGVVSSHQQAFIDTVNENGGIGFVARSIDDVHANLKGVK